jgi:hypothetical protein
MNFTNAFAVLGYDLTSPRTDWSAERDDGVCFSLWSREIKWGKGEGSFDTRRDAMPIETWNTKPGFKKRVRHMQRAVDEFGGRIDVILVSGEPGMGYEDAHPWKPEVRKGAWFVEWFEPETGHFTARMRAD